MTDKVIKKWKQKIRDMKKEDYIVLLLIGVLLVIISLPADKDRDDKGADGSGKGSGLENVLEGGREEGSDSSARTGDAAVGQEGGMTAGEWQNMEEDRSGSGQDRAVEAGNFNNNSSYDIDTYVENLEKRVEEMLSGMEGAGKVQVMITVSDTGMEILEKDRESSVNDLEETDDAGGRRKNTENGQREEVIYIKDAEGNETPYVVQRKLPEVAGVVVLAEGAGNARVKENIIGAVGVLFNLNEHRIRVIRMKS